MKKSIIFSLLCVLSQQLMAQKISGIVKDDTGKPVGGATVFLLEAKDSSTIKFAATNYANYHEFYCSLELICFAYSLCFI